MWKDIKEFPIPEYDWVILGKYIEEDDTISWQIGRKLPHRHPQFWNSGETGGPWQGDSFYIWEACEATHWIWIPDFDEKEDE